MSKKRSYRLEYSQFVSNELTRLKNGNNPEQKRFKQAQEAIAKIQSDPINREFSKTLPDNYKTADVLGQYRLFFIIHNISDDSGIIFLAWINDEKSLHAYGKKTDAYKVFRDLLGKEEIETYTPLPPKEDPRYNQHGEWGESLIYFDLEQITSDGNMWANSHLYLTKNSTDEYIIVSVSVSHPNEKLTKNLILFICKEAQKKNISLYYELDTLKPDLDKNHHLLEVSGFTKIDSIKNDEIWEKKP